MDPLISVIVPIYNVEKYISRCIQSILTQDYSNIEIILVNDGSEDSSGQIIDNFHDNRIVLVQKKNEGVAAARNEGLNRAKGEYIIFVDGDDYVDENYVKYLYALVKTKNCEMGISSDCYAEEKYNTSCKYNNKADNVEKISSTEIIKGIYYGRYSVAVWNKIYSTKLLKENNIYFNANIWYGEGMLFNIVALTCVKEVAVGNRKIYHQVYNSESAVRKFSLKNHFCGMYSLELQKQYLDISNPKIIDAWEYHFSRYGYSILKGLYETNCIKDNKELCLNCKYMLRKNFQILIKADVSFKTKIFNILTAIFPDFMACVGARKAIRKKQSFMNPEF